MRARRLAPLPGTATRWQNHLLTNASSFVVELPAGALRATAVRRHVRAVGAVAALVRARPAVRPSTLRSVSDPE
jgi:hypothetical protein